MRLSSRSPAQRALTLLQFQQLLLSSTNHAEDVAALAEVDDSHAIFDYWVSCSHNTWLRLGLGLGSGLGLGLGLADPNASPSPSPSSNPNLNP